MHKGRGSTDQDEALDRFPLRGVEAKREAGVAGGVKGLTILVRHEHAGVMKLEHRARRRLVAGSFRDQQLCHSAVSS